MKFKTSEVVVFSLSLLLIAIMLPIGLGYLTDFSDSEIERSSGYTSQSVNGTLTLNTTITSGQGLRVSGTYDNSTYYLQLQLLYGSNGTVISTNTTTTNNITQLFWNATITGNIGIKFTNLTIGIALVDVSIVEITYIDYDSSIISIVGKVIPLVVTIGVIVMFLSKKYKN